MAYEPVKRNEFNDPDPVKLATHVSKYHSDDIQDFHIPMERMHNSNLHDWGIARGLEVSGTIDSTEIVVNAGVAIDKTGQLISLSRIADIGENPPGQSNEVIVPVHLSTDSFAGKTVYVTIKFLEKFRDTDGVLGRWEQVPWVRLQPVEAYDGESIVLAIAVLKEAGKLSELKAMDNAFPHRRRLIGECIEELRIQRSSKIGDQVQDIISGKIGPGEGGGLKITVSDSQDSILFAREGGDDFGKLEIRANVGIGTPNPKEKLDVSGTIRLFGKNAFQGSDSFLRINQDNEFPSGTHFAHRANFAGGITTGSWQVEPGAGNLLVQGKVGIGVKNPSYSLEVVGNIRMYPIGRHIQPSRSSSIIVGSDDPINNAVIFSVTRDDVIGPIPPTAPRRINVGDGWTFNARSKHFLIDHPLHPDTHELVHSTLEGPETAVFYRGEAQLSNGKATVTLPDYFEALTRKENRTVLLTPEFEEGIEVSTLAASKVKDGKFTVKMIDSKNPSQKFYWEVKAIRADVDILEVEREKIQ